MGFIKTMRNTVIRIKTWATQTFATTEQYEELKELANGETDVSVNETEYNTMLDEVMPVD